MGAITVKKSATYSGHRDCVYTLEKDCESRFFSGAGDGMVVNWDLNEPDKGTLIAKVKNSVYSLHFSPEKKYLYIGHNFEGIHMVDPHSKAEVQSASITKAAIFDIKSYQDWLFVGTGDGFLIILSLEDLSTIAKFKVSDKSLRTFAVDPLGRFLAAGFSDNSFRVFDLQDNFKKVYEVTAHENSIFTLRFSPDGKFLLSGSRDAHLKVWSCEQNFKLHSSIVAHMYAINSIDYNSNGNLFATCSMDKSIKIWDAERFALLKVIDKARHAGHGTSVNKLYWSSYNNQLVSCSDDRSISVWDLKESI
ncbi:WD40 repeat domain-containing protein [Cytophagaceae bacterium ABcell3]|nr:WD40 repeat domain-containing protein [Cytophagaceae bacterium ABcell3]